MSVYSGYKTFLFVCRDTFASQEVFQEEESPLTILANLLTHQFSECSLLLWMTAQFHRMLWHFALVPMSMGLYTISTKVFNKVVQPCPTYPVKKKEHFPANRHSLECILKGNTLTSAGPSRAPCVGKQLTIVQLSQNSRIQF